MNILRMENNVSNIQITNIEEATTTRTTENDLVLPKRSTRKAAPRKLDNYITYLASSSTEPKTWKKVLQGCDTNKWKEAMDAEIHSLHKNRTWTLIDLPENKKLVDMKWIFRIKTNADGSINKYKARLVARGFSQEFGVDYNETYSPVMRHTSLRFLLALAVKRKLDFDI